MIPTTPEAIDRAVEILDKFAAYFDQAKIAFMEGSPVHKLRSDHAQEARSVAASLRALLEAQPRVWQPMETAPRDGTDILLFIPTWFNGRGGFTVGRWNGESFSIYMHEPSAWMPLPHPPTGNEAGKGEAP